MGSGPSPLLGIVGPTASGKTDLALAVARELPVEILVADSRQVYRGMDVGTATPSAEARAGVPHHLLDLVDPDEPFTVAQWVEAARATISQLSERRRVPLVVGGTGLYVAALLEGHDYSSQGWSPAIRRALGERLEATGLESLVAELRERDPTRAAGIDLRNPRRVVRALERAISGEPATATNSTPYAGPVALVGLSRPRGVLYGRIDERARRLFEVDGLLHEVRALLDRGFSPELRPMSGHGYREAIGHLAGEWSMDEAIAVTARRTRQYAKRQLTWFRADPTIQWIDAGDRPADDPPIVEEAVRILAGAR